jgi:hypothetical protein
MKQLVGKSITWKRFVGILPGNSFLRDIEDVHYFYREFFHLQAPEDEKETHESQQKSELNTANYSRTKPD